jgi:hypothetical protein
MTWIKTEERMPKVNEDVLFVFTDYHGDEFIVLGYICDNLSHWEARDADYSHFCSESVNYWMPLPEVPNK